VERLWTVPTFTCCPVNGLGIRLYPCGIANGYAVDIHHGLLAPASNTEPGVPHSK